MTLFLLGVFAVPWALLLLLLDDAAPGAVWPVLAWIFPTVWAPTILAVALTLWTEGAAGVKQLVSRLRYTRGSGRWLLVAAAVPAVATAAAVIAARGAGDGASFIPVAALPVVIIVQLLTGATGEELGWRGFLLPRLAQRFGAAKAAGLMGALWGAWHIPGFLFPGMPHQMMPPVPALLFTALFGVFLGFLFFRTRGSVFATMAAHLSLNIATALGGISFSAVVYWWMLAGIFAVVAVLIVWSGVGGSRVEAQATNVAAR